MRDRDSQGGFMTEENEQEDQLEKTECNCDLENFLPEPDSGHTFGCRIHQAVLEAKLNQR